VTVTAGATIVWLAPEPPDATQDRVISAWARAHGDTLSPPANERPPTLARNEDAAVDVDELLDRARAAITERDGDAADRALESAQQVLQAHAELTNAAWLMAEVLRERSARWRRVLPTDESAADRAWAQADGLDGGRIAGVGEQAAAVPARGATLVLAAPLGEQAWLDGALVGTAAGSVGSVGAREGPHVLAVTWKGAPVWAEWIDLGPGTTRVTLPAPPAPPCSVGDLENVRAARGEVEPPADVRCARWIAATTGLLPDAVRIATCEGNRCGELLDWRPSPDWAGSLQRKPPPGPRWPAWATWSLVGAGVAAAAGIVAAIASGSSSGPGEMQFVSGGLKTP
jgi:hypothetical protein